MPLFKRKAKKTSQIVRTKFQSPVLGSNDHRLLSYSNVNNDHVVKDKIDSVNDISLTLSSKTDDKRLSSQRLNFTPKNFEPVSKLNMMDSYSNLHSPHESFLGSILGDNRQNISSPDSLLDFSYSSGISLSQHAMNHPKIKSLYGKFVNEDSREMNYPEEKLSFDINELSPEIREDRPLFSAAVPHGKIVTKKKREKKNRKLNVGGFVKERHLESRCNVLTMNIKPKIKGRKTVLPEIQGEEEESGILNKPKHNLTTRKNIMGKGKKNQPKNKSNQNGSNSYTKYTFNKEELLELQEERNVGIYVICDNCEKTRFLQNIQDPLDLPDKWFCSMNPDFQYNNCTSPEIDIPQSEEERFIENEYNAGSVVWAKMDGYPWWPAIVDDDPDILDYFWLDREDDIKPTWYHVTFFDSLRVSRAWIKTGHLKPFRTNINYSTQQNYKMTIFRKYQKRIETAVEQAHDASRMQLLDRLRKYSFLSRYNESIEIKPRTSSRKNRRARK